MKNYCMLIYCEEGRFLRTKACENCGWNHEIHEMRTKDVRENGFKSKFCQWKPKHDTQ